MYVIMCKLGVLFRSSHQEFYNVGRESVSVGHFRNHTTYATKRITSLKFFSLIGTKYLLVTGSGKGTRDRVEEF